MIVIPVWIVIPAEAGIQDTKVLDSGLRRNDNHFLSKDDCSLGVDT